MQRRRGERVLDAKFWQRANTALALIRAGYATKGELAEWLNLPGTTVWLIITKLVELGLVTKKPGVGTLHLAEPAQGLAPYVILGVQSSDGAIKRIPPKRGGIC